MRQILTILWDSYKLLLDKKLFWVALVISILLALIYASIGIEADRISIFFNLKSWELDEMFVIDKEDADRFYLSIFSGLFLPFWLGGMAIALGLISVCSVFPETMKTGAVDVVLSKPISRVTLFFTKYLGSCMFVGAQVFVFCLIVFLAMGFRTGEWVFGIFSAVWLILFSFSLIYSVAVLVSIWSKSTLLSLLAAFFAWGLSWGLQFAEAQIYKTTFTMSKMGINYDGTDSATAEPDSFWVELHYWIDKASLPLPKTREVTYLVKRKIVINGRNLTQPADDEYVDVMTQAQMEFENRHSQSYILGTSLAFQFVVLGLACWSFTRKEF